MATTSLLRHAYRCLESTIADGVTNSLVDITKLPAGARTIAIVNDTGTALSLGVRFNATTNDLITVKAGRLLLTNTDELNVTAIYLTNGSGNTVTYQIIATY